MNILIIDDDAIDRMSAIRTLGESELTLDQVDQAPTAEEGIRLATQRKYNVILLDYQIPPYNGIEVLREIRGSNDYATSIVMLSHSNDEQLALDCIEAGAQDFVMKSEVTATRLKRAILLSAERHHLELQVRDSHDMLRRLAEQDSLTGLSNRYFFDEALKDAIPKAERNGKQLAVVLLDLDKFKNINDTLGHQAGDIFLQEVAQRMEVPIREGDKLCRLGGDEFAILVHDLVHPTQVRLLVNRVFDALAGPVEIDGHSLEITASVGIATYPDCATDAVGLMKCADVAMYRSKSLGRNQVQYYSRTFHQAVESRVRIENDLGKALAANQLLLHYQPQVDAKDSSLVGIEALIRWEHPELGLVPPDEFIPIAEESNLIIEIGRWVIDTACRQFSEWLKAGASTNMKYSIAANLSARQLKDGGLVSFLTSCLEKYQIPPASLELELTESSLEQSLSALDMLNSLTDMGIQLALDDFGTGYSSLSHLKQYPLNILKIDKSFVQNIDDKKQANLLKAICSFAHSLEYETVAEGVETKEQVKICRELGVKRLQGYFFSRPLPAHQLKSRWLS
ncbi:diguanylate cyclase [Saccharospirillum sp. MSK14-1]|uniref:putative bifunctional diguanylate cyclase/phosphodiesterase n=1 Tax=Saccharospirillum sp. MSK14-1 TaxID=1897632 RepID=UPI000D376F12|nr:GGDEF domain-containing response regulator [Saccharospirillum sp. MSK14-1]PTY36859.1 diguanylate cyclase [Saccharospirillum sp. MSK14-1]